MWRRQGRDEKHSYRDAPVYKNEQHLSIYLGKMLLTKFSCVFAGAYREMLMVGGGSPGGESCLYVCCNPINAVFALSISCCNNLLSEVKTRQGRKTEEQKNWIMGELWKPDARKTTEEWKNGWIFLTPQRGNIFYFTQ